MALAMTAYRCAHGVEDPLALPVPGTSRQENHASDDVHASDRGLESPEPIPIPSKGGLPMGFATEPATGSQISSIEMLPMRWWEKEVARQVLDRPKWVSFDLETVLLDTLAQSPRVQSIAYQTSATYQRITQQDAAFDPSILLSSNLGATDDPVGNTLTTGGADRLREQSLDFKGGVRQRTRRGTEIEWGQEIGFLDSNSSFFVPRNQGNARLSISLTKPLLSRGGRFYNERLVTQAQIESNVAWQDMRNAIEQRIADVMTAYWQLYQLRAQLAQQRALLNRSRAIERLLSSRKDFDAARIEIAKAKQRVARRGDQVIALEAELKKQQAQLAALVGSETLTGAERNLELIPTATPAIPQQTWTLREAVTRAMENRPEIRAATRQLELSALELRITRVELEPQLNWIFNGYLAELNAGSRVQRSFWEQFENGPGISTALEYELPRGRRVARSRHHEAQLRYRQRNEQLRDAILNATFEIESALIDLDRYAKQRISKQNVLATALDEENILTVQWRLMGGDGSRVGIKLENLLDAQQRRTDAEQDLVAAESAYMIALIRLHRSMGTLLINEGIQPYQDGCSGEITFEHRIEAISSPYENAAGNERATPDGKASADPKSTSPMNTVPVTARFTARKPKEAEFQFVPARDDSGPGVRQRDKPACKRLPSTAPKRLPKVSVSQ
jgi:outer membrane protein TolC